MPRAGRLGWRLRPRALPPIPALQHQPPTRKPVQGPARLLPAIRRLAIAALACATLLPMAPVHADTVSDLQAQINADEAQLAAIASRMAGIESMKASAQYKIAALQVVIDRLTVALTGLNAKVSQEQTAVNDLKAREVSLQAQIKVTQADLVRRQAALALDLRTVDKQSQLDPLLYVFGARSFTDLLRRTMSLSELGSWNRRLADQLKADRDRLEADRVQLAAARAQEEQVLATIQEQQKTVQQEYDAETEAANQIAALQAQLGAEQQGLSFQAQQLSAQVTADQAQIDQLLWFSRHHGSGGSIVSPEYLSDAWGSYYNQRDARWGNDYMGNSPYQVWEIGCLLSSVAMTYSHFGFVGVTPAVLAANPGNFTSGGEMLNSALNIPGHPADQNWGPTRDWINAYLDSGGTVIVGMNIYTGGTHFVVITGRDGPYDYWINDPWDQWAMHIPFSRSPNTGSIYEAIGYR